MNKTRVITNFELMTLKRRNYTKCENGYTESLEYTVNRNNEVVCNYYFNDGNIIDNQTILGTLE